MKEKIVVITGANSGIGKAAALKFATEGYHVIMACRNTEVSTKVQKEITEASKNNRVELMELDVSSFKSIQKFSIEYKARFDRLDILIHNAAYFNHGEKNYQHSPDGIELTFATNTFGPYLMTKLLKDSLEKSVDARILNACTTNIRHFFDPKRKLEFDNLQGEYKNTRPYSVYKNYGDSKMALLMLTFRMAEEYKGTGININAIQIPAIKVSKETIKKLKSFWKVFAMIQNTFTPLPSTMADTYFHICTSNEFKNLTGKFINDKREVIQPSEYGEGLIEDIKQFFDQSVYPKYADDSNTIQKVWELSENLTK